MYKLDVAASFSSGANLAERLSGQIGLPLDLAHKR